MLGSAEHNTCLLQHPPDCFIGDPQPRAFGQIIRQTLQGPQGEWSVETAGPTPDSGQQYDPIYRVISGGMPRAGCIWQPFKALGYITLEPAGHGGLTLTDNAGNRWDLEALFQREQIYLGTRPQPRSLGGTV